MPTSAIIHHMNTTHTLLLNANNALNNAAANLESAVLQITWDSFSTTKVGGTAVLYVHDELYFVTQVLYNNVTDNLVLDNNEEFTNSTDAIRNAR